MELYRIEVPAGHEIKQIDSTHWELVRIDKYLPKTWEDFCRIHPIRKSELVLDYYADICRGREGRHRDPRFDRTHLPDEETAKAMRALCQLIQLRNFYNGDWVPDWKNANERKWAIAVCRDKVEPFRYETANKVLAFKSEEIRDQFLENFRDLIEIAKPLL